MNGRVIEYVQLTGPKPALIKMYCGSLRLENCSSYDCANKAKKKKIWVDPLRNPTL